eukprot:25752_1
MLFVYVIFLFFSICTLGIAQPKSRRPNKRPETWHMSFDCESRRDAGPCFSSIPLWYYDHDKGKCIKFIWGGCGGNHNRYGTKLQCETICIEKKKIESRKAAKKAKRAASSDGGDN